MGMWKCGNVKCGNVKCGSAGVWRFGGWTLGGGGFSRRKGGDDAVREGRCGEHVPEKCHRKIFEDGAEPDGWEAEERGVAWDYREEKGGNETHCGTHN